MSSLRVTSLKGRSGNQSPTLPDGVVVTGVTTSTSFDGNLNATQLSSGTVADARLGTVSSSKLSGALPALDGSALTNLNIPAGFSELDAALFN
jgi:hypothetical protein